MFSNHASRKNRRFKTVVSIAIAAIFLFVASAPGIGAGVAEAATSGTVMGSGNNSSTVVKLESGLYDVTYSYTGNSTNDRFAARLYGEKGVVPGGEIVSTCNAQSGKQTSRIKIDVGGTFYVNVTSANDNTQWQFSFKKTSMSNIVKTNSIKGTGPGATPFFYLPKGTSSFTFAYTNNLGVRSYDTNFILHLCDTDGNTAAFCLNDIEGENTVKKSFSIKNAGYYYFALTHASQTAEWTFTIPSHVKNDWIKNADGTKSYYKKGKMLTGWQKISGKKYYFGKDGKMKTGWQKISGKKYYFGKDGKMRTGKVKIGKKYYKFNKNGALVK